MRLKYLLLSLCLVGFAQPAVGQQIHWRNGLTTSAEHRVICGPYVGCVAIRLPSQCRWTLLGGVYQGTSHKVT
jgi:hypothetical protein